jgi:hypothetical protein
MKTLRLTLVIAVLTIIAARAFAIDFTYNVTNVAELQSLNMTGVTNEIVDVLGYYAPGDRGGGVFHWDPNASDTPDEGRIFEPSSWSGNGRWVRDFAGESANIRMWGAVGNIVPWSDPGGIYAHDDTTNIQNAINSFNGQPTDSRRMGLLLIPMGFYKVTAVMIFPSFLHISGEGPYNTQIVSVGDTDVFRTSNTQSALTNGPVAWDQGLMFENLSIINSSNNGTAGSALEVCLPGEASVIRNVEFNGFGYGIRCFGIGAPGLRLENVSIFDSYIANIYFTGSMTNGTVVGMAGPVTLLAISGDHRRADSDATASFVKVDQCTPTISVYDFKAEGDYGGGIINYTKPANAGNIGSVTVYGGTYNAGGATYPPDLVVLNSYTASTAAVEINMVNLYFVNNLIRDNLTGRTILTHTLTWVGSDQTTCRQPIAYQGSLWWTRYVIGDTAYAYIEHPTTGWYRVMKNQLNKLGGSLAINSIDDESKVDVEDLPWDANIELNVPRTTRDDGVDAPPFVTAVRAGNYYDHFTNAWVAFLDIQVTRTNTDGYPQDDLVTLAHPIEGHVDQTGREELLSPIVPLTSLVPSTNCWFLNCVTNTLTR